MLLDGAKFSCVDKNGKPVRTIIAKGKKFTIGCFVDCDYVVEQAENIHCQIECDAFGHVTIYNKSHSNPISVNGETVTIKRTLFNNSKIRILNKDYVWQHPKATSTNNEATEEGMSTPSKQIGIMLQQPNSCPTLKYHRNLDNRLTVHNLRAYRIDTDEGNCADHSDSTAAEINQTAEELQNCDSAGSTKRSNSPNDLVSTPAKVDLVDSTTDKKTSSTEKRLKTFRNVWGWSGITATSYSPREAGVRIEKTFTALIAPTTSNSSFCRTPKGLLERLGDGGGGGKQLESNDIMVLATPAKQSCSENNANISIHYSGGILLQHKKSAMKIVDMTTPVKLRPASPFRSMLAASNKKPSSVKSFASFSENSTVKKQIPMTPIMSTPKSIISSIETPVSTSSAITVDSSSALSDLSTEQRTAATNTTPNPMKSTTTGSILRKQALLASTKKQSTTTPAATPVTTKQNYQSVSPFVADCSKLSNKKQLQSNRKLLAADSSLSSPSKLKKDTSISMTKQTNDLSNIGGNCATTSKFVSGDVKNYLTTSTPYKVANKNDSKQQQQDTSTIKSEFFSALHCTNEDGELGEIPHNDAPKTATTANEGDILLQQIEEILNTSDELKRQIQATKTANDADNDISIESNAMILTVSPPPASIDLIEPNDPQLKQSPKSNVVIASVLLKAIDNAEKQKAAVTFSPKEDEEKENKINKILGKPPLLTTNPRRRISLSTPAADETTLQSTSTHVTPLTSKRPSKSWVSVDEIPQTTLANRTIDHFNTENMGAIIKEDVAIASNETDKNCLTLDASAAPSTSIACGALTCVSDSNKTSAEDVTSEIEGEVDMSPLQCLDESFAEPCQSDVEQEVTGNNTHFTEEHLENSAMLELSVENLSKRNLPMKITITECEGIENTLHLDESFGEIEYLEDDGVVTEETEHEEEFNRTFEVKDATNTTTATADNVVEQLATPNEISIIEVECDEEIEQDKTTNTMNNVSAAIPINTDFSFDPNETVDLTMNDSLEIVNSQLHEANMAQNLIEKAVGCQSKEKSTKDPDKTRHELNKSTFDMVIEHNNLIPKATADDKAQTLNDDRNEKLKTMDEISIIENDELLLVEQIEVTHLITEEQLESNKIIQMNSEKAESSSTLHEMSNAGGSNYLTKMNITQMLSDEEQETKVLEKELKLPNATQVVPNDCKGTIAKSHEISTFLDKLQVTQLTANERVKEEVQIATAAIDVNAVSEVQSNKEVKEKVKSMPTENNDSIAEAEKRQSDVEKRNESLKTTSSKLQTKNIGEVENLVDKNNLTNVSTLPEASSNAQKNLENSRVSPDLFEFDATIPQNEADEANIACSKATEVEEKLINHLIEEHQEIVKSNVDKDGDTLNLELLEDTTDEVATKPFEVSLHADQVEIKVQENAEIPLELSDDEKKTQKPFKLGENELEQPLKVSGNELDTAQSSKVHEVESEQPLEVAVDEQDTSKKSKATPQQPYKMDTPFQLSNKVNEVDKSSQVLDAKPDQLLEVFEDKQKPEKSSKEREVDLVVSNEEEIKNSSQVHEGEPEQLFAISDKEQKTETKKPSKVVKGELPEQLHVISDDEHKAEKPSKVHENDLEQPLELSDDEQETEKSTEVVEVERVVEAESAQSFEVSGDKQKVEKSSKDREAEPEEMQKTSQVQEAESEEPLEVTGKQEEIVKPNNVDKDDQEQFYTISENEHKTEKPSKLPETELEQPIELSDDEQETENFVEMHEVEVDRVLQTKSDQPTEDSGDDQKVEKSSKEGEAETEENLEVSGKEQETEKQSKVDKEKQEQFHTISDVENETEKSSKVREAELEQMKKSTQEQEATPHQPLVVSGKEQETDKQTYMDKADREQLHKISDDKQKTVKPSKVRENELEQPLELSDDEQETEKSSEMHEADKPLEVFGNEQKIEKSSEKCETELKDMEMSSQVHEAEPEEPLEVYGKEQETDRQTNVDKDDQEQIHIISDDAYKTEKPSEERETQLEQPLALSDNKQEAEQSSKIPETQLEQPIELSDDEQETEKSGEMREVELERVLEAEPAQSFEVSVDEQVEKSSKEGKAESSQVQEAELEQPLELFGKEQDTEKQRKVDKEKQEQLHIFSDDENETERSSEVREIELEETLKVSIKEHEIVKQTKVDEDEQKQLHAISNDEHNTEKPSEIRKTQLERPLALSDNEQEAEKSFEIPETELEQPLQLSDDEQQTEKSSEMHEVEVERVLQEKSDKPLEVSGDVQKVEESSKVCEAEPEEMQKTSQVQEAEPDEPFEVAGKEQKTVKQSKVDQEKQEQFHTISDDKNETQKSSELRETESKKPIQHSDDEQETEKSSMIHVAEPEKSLEATFKEQETQETPEVTIDDQELQLHVISGTEKKIENFAKVHEAQPEMSLAISNQPKVSSVLVLPEKDESYDSSKVPESSLEKPPITGTITSPEAISNDTKPMENNLENEERKPLQVVEDINQSDSIENLTPADHEDQQLTTKITNKKTKATKSRAATKKGEQESVILPSKEEEKVKLQQPLENEIKINESENETATTVNRSQRGGLRRRGANAPKYDETSDTEIDNKKQSRKRRSGGAVGGSHQKISTPKKQIIDETAEADIVMGSSTQKTKVKTSRVTKHNLKNKLDTEEDDLETHDAKVPKKRARKNLKQANDQTHDIVQVDPTVEEKQTVSDQQKLVEAELIEKTVEESAKKPKRGRPKNLEKLVEHKDEQAAVVAEPIAEKMTKEATTPAKKSQSRRKPITQTASIDKSDHKVAELAEDQEQKVDTLPQSKPATVRKPRGGKRGVADTPQTYIDNVLEPKVEPPTSQQQSQFPPQKRSRRLNSQVGRTVEEEPPLDINEEEPDAINEESVADAAASEGKDQQIEALTSVVATTARGGRGRGRGKNIDADCEPMEEPTTKSRQRAIRQQKKVEVDEIKEVEEKKDETKSKARNTKPKKTAAEQTTVATEEGETEIDNEVKKPATKAIRSRRGGAGSKKKDQAVESMTIENTTKEETVAVEESKDIKIVQETKTRRGRRGAKANEEEQKIFMGVTSTQTKAKTKKHATEKAQTKIEEIQTQQHQESNENTSENKEEFSVAVADNDDAASNVASKEETTPKADTQKQIRKKRAATGGRAKTTKKTQLEIEESEASSNVDNAENEPAPAVKLTQSRSRRAPKKGSQIQEKEDLATTTQNDEATSKSSVGSGSHNKSKHVHFNETPNTLVSPTEEVIDETKLETATAEKIPTTKRRRRN